MKQININITEYMPAPIDDKNVMSDSIMESLFDGGNYVSEKNEAMGFVGGYPTMAFYQGCQLELSLLKREPSMDDGIIWASTVVEHLTGNDYKTFNVMPGLSVAYLCEYRNLITWFALHKTNVTIRYAYDVKEQ